MIDIIVNLDVLPGKREISLTELADKVGIIMSNVYVLKKSKTKAIRPSTLESICKVLNYKPGDILLHKPDKDALKN